jgi:hypothetical protein
MKRTVISIRLPKSDNMIEVPEPGIFCALAMKVEVVQGGLIQHAGQPHQAVREWPTLLVEVDPDNIPDGGEKCARRFRLIEEGQVIDEEDVIYHGMAVSQSLGKPLFLYEIFETKH